MASCSSSALWWLSRPSPSTWPRKATRLVRVGAPSCITMRRTSQPWICSWFRPPADRDGPAHAAFCPTQTMPLHRRKRFHVTWECPLWAQELNRRLLFQARSAVWPDRQDELKERPMFAVRRRRKVTAMAVDNHPAKRQSQSHSLRLCRNEHLRTSVSASTRN